MRAGEAGRNKADTKAENEELVKLTGLIQAIEKPNELSKSDDLQKEM